MFWQWKDEEVRSQDSLVANLRNLPSSSPKCLRAAIAKSGNTKSDPMGRAPLRVARALAQQNRAPRLHRRPRPQSHQLHPPTPPPRARPRRSLLPNRTPGDHLGPQVLRARPWQPVRSPPVRHLLPTASLTLPFPLARATPVPSVPSRVLLSPVLRTLPALQRVKAPVRPPNLHQLMGVDLSLLPRALWQAPPALHPTLAPRRPAIQAGTGSTRRLRSALRASRAPLQLRQAPPPRPRRVPPRLQRPQRVTRRAALTRCLVQRSIVGYVLDAFRPVASGVAAACLRGHARVRRSQQLVPSVTHWPGRGCGARSDPDRFQCNTIQTTRYG